MKRLNSVGDTIVEVLLAVIVVGGVLAAAYVSSSRSLNANRASQERGEALKYVESQVEKIKANVSTPAGPGPVGTYYCLDSASAPRSLLTNPPALDSDTWTSYPSQCIVGNIPAGYHLLIFQPASGIYFASARWDRAGGGGKEQIIIVYKVSP
jgi:Tfp pilus assembly protein PilV